MRRRRMMKNQGFTAEEKVIVTNYIKNAFQKIDLYRISDDFWSLIISILPQEILLHIQKTLEKYNETDRENRRISKKSFKHLPIYKKISKECIYLEDYEQEEIFDIIEKYIYTVKSKNLVLKKVKKLEKIFDLNLEELEIISFFYLKNANEWDFCGYEFDRDQSIENFLNIPNSNIKKLLSHKNTLMYNEIINKDNDFALSETMMEYLSTDSSSLLNYLCTKEYGDYDIESCCDTCDANGGDSYFGAVKTCKDIGGRLPTMGEVQSLARYLPELGFNVMSGLAPVWYEASSSNPKQVSSALCNITNGTCSIYGTNRFGSPWSICVKD